MWIRDARLDQIGSDWLEASQSLLLHQCGMCLFQPKCQESLCIVQVPAGGISGFKAFQGHASKSQFETPQHAKSQKMFKGTSLSRKCGGWIIISLPVVSIYIYAGEHFFFEDWWLRSKGIACCARCAWRTPAPKTEKNSSQAMKGIAGSKLSCSEWLRASWNENHWVANLGFGWICIYFWPWKKDQFAKTWDTDFLLTFLLSVQNAKNKQCRP